MCADIAEGRRAQQGIDDGMYDRICVRMTREALCEGNGYTTKDEWTVRGESVDVVAKADTRSHNRFPCMKASASSRSS